MEYYPLIKQIHIATAVLSLVGFAIRGWWMIKESVFLNHRLVKIFPHINDSLLLISAVYLSAVSGLYPFMQSWLGIKVLLLVGYIIAGTIALKRGSTKIIRIKAFVVALLCIGMIFSHAIYRPTYW